MKSSYVITPEVAFAEGVIRPNDITYFEKDHLGSVRVTLNQSGSVTGRNDYYPFGMRHTGGLVNQNNRYLFNGKEDQVTGGLNLLDYGARMYDSEISRWFNMDPLAEKYYRWSPYTYTLNNPIRFIDPNGMEVINGDEDEYKKKEKEREDAQQRAEQAKADYGEDSREYRRAARSLNSANRQYERAKSTYEATQQKIDDFAATDPMMFIMLQILQYTDDNGIRQNLDIIVKTGSLPSGFTDGLTSYGLKESNGRMGLPEGMNKISITLESSSRDNALAHEFGHVFSAAADPRGYHKAVKDAGHHDCQTASPDHPVSKGALIMQKRYDGLRTGKISKFSW